MRYTSHHAPKINIFDLVIDIKAEMANRFKHLTQLIHFHALPIDKYDYRNKMPMQLPTS